MCGAICIGVLVSITAGIAYGYNYMLAEFVTLGRQDMSVYVRRGQFNDKPDFAKAFRRRGDENDLFSSNASDYQDTKTGSDSKPLSDTWRKALDTRKYAEKLTKYSLGRIGSGFNDKNLNDVDDFDTTTPPPDGSVIRRVYSITPNPVLATTILPGRTDIIMRIFKPNDITISPESKTLEAEFYQEFDRTHEGAKPKHKQQKPDIKISLNDSPDRKYVPMRTWDKSKSSQLDSPLEEVDEDNVVYKPV